MKRKVVEGTTPIWPEKFTPEHIAMLKKQKSNYEFSTQYNNEPIPDSDQQFKREWFRYFIDDDIKRRNIFNFTMVDPAISQESGADFTVLTTISVDEYYNWFVREVVRGHFLPNEIIEEMFKVNERYHPIEMGLEVQAYQKMLAYSLRDEMRTRKKYLPLREIKQPTNKSKETRIKSLQPGYYNGKIFHRERMINLEYLEDELLRFPRGAHDDIIDTLASLTEFAVPPKSERKKSIKSSYLY
jgi:predicted phage terminase large subunit-like protein